MSDIRYIVIHHSASTGTLQAENGYHTRPAPNGNDWYKLSYHFSIDRGGIYQINDILDITPHAKGANDHGIGICVNWDLRLRGLTDFEKNALYGLITTLKDMFPNAEIVGHNEISKRLANHATSCPVISMNQLRSDIMDAEQEMERAETPQKQDEIAYRMANHILYLQNMSRGKKSDGSAATPEQSKWALAQLLKMEPEFRRLGFLK
jgi:hypothetical protein